jgi:hypothetical protein
MIHWQKVLQIAALVLSVNVNSSGAAVAQQKEPSCAETMTEQLRRFSEKCLSDRIRRKLFVSEFQLLRPWSQ